MERVHIKFVFDRKKKAANGMRGQVEIRFTCGKRQKYLGTGISLLSWQWNDKEECVVECAESASCNCILQTYRTRAMKELARMVESGERLDLEELRRKVAGPGQTEITFLEYVERRMVQKHVTESTKKRYEVFLRFLERWGRIVTFSDITEARVRDMDELLFREGKTQSTVYDYHKHLKQFINDAVVDGYLKENVYTARRIKIKRGEKENVDSLSEPQLARLMGLELRNLGMVRARDLFLFQCFTGLAYADLMGFDFSNCQQDETGRWYTMGNRKKTGSAFVLVLVPQAMEILIRYNYRLPRLSNQKYNVQLKALGALIGADNLHSHMGRGTFASLALNHGVPIDVLQRMVGHRQRQQTQRYARMWNETIKDGFGLIADGLAGASSIDS